jgi:hypothetical protein
LLQKKFIKTAKLKIDIMENLPSPFLELKDVVMLTKAPSGLSHYGTKLLNVLMKLKTSSNRIGGLGGS